MSETAEVEVPPESTLDDVFTNEEPPKDDTPEPEPQETPTEAAQPDESEEKTPDEGSPSEPEPHHVPLAGLLDERDKRQKAEGRIAELEKLLAEKQEPEKRPSVLDDEEGFASSLMSELQQERLKDKFDLSRDLMQMNKPDFAEKEALFMELAADDDSLQKKLLAHPNPARFAYETAEKHEELKSMENLDDWRDKEKAKLKAEMKDELRKEWEEEQQNAAKKAGAVTPSLASKQSAGGTDTVSAEEPSLDEVLGG